MTGAAVPEPPADQHAASEPADADRPESAQRQSLEQLLTWSAELRTQVRYR